MKKFVFAGMAALFLTLSCTREQTGAADAASAATVEEVRPATSAIQHLTPWEATKLLDQGANVVVLDVRTREEFNRGHLENAINLDIQDPDFEKKLQKLEPDRTYLIYCAVGGRSSKAADLMEKYGFTHIYNCQQGFDELKESGAPVQE